MQDKLKTIKNELAGLINSHSLENGSNTPDFILAAYLLNCLAVFDHANNWNTAWHSKDGVPVDWRENGPPSAVRAHDAESAPEQPEGDVVENDLLAVIDERDKLEDRLTLLAEAVGEYFEVPVGEWSSGNDPAEEAMKILNGEYKTRFDGYYSLEAVEKAIRWQMEIDGWGVGPSRALAQRIRARLAPKPSPLSTGYTGGITPEAYGVRCNRCGVFVDDQIMHDQWHAALFPKTGGAK